MLVVRLLAYFILSIGAHSGDVQVVAARPAARLFRCAAGYLVPDRPERHPELVPLWTSRRAKQCNERMPRRRYDRRRAFQAGYDPEIRDIVGRFLGVVVAHGYAHARAVFIQLRHPVEIPLLAEVLDHP